jgi:predicted 2-oxoglutarate/Fe(II)-dependent dioxygenase YbiX
MHKEPIDNIFILKNAIRKEDIKTLMDHARQAQMNDAVVQDVNTTISKGSTAWMTNKEIRDTQIIETSELIRQKATSINNYNIRKHINPFYKFEIRDCEAVSLLHYGIGGHYLPHNDSEAIWIHNDGTEVWRKVVDRDISVVYFLNDDFEGGELEFPELKLKVKPESGTMICFPSTHQYHHGVNKVTSGNRFTMVTWMRVKGFQTLEDTNRIFSLINSQALR